MMARMSAAVSQPLTTPPGTAGPPSSAGSSESPNAPDRGKRWTRICAREDIPRLGARVVRRPYGGNIAIFRTASDTFFALADRCPHRGGPLSQGIVYGDRVACPLHNTNVELPSGCAVAPDKGQVETFDVKIEGDFVFLALSANGGENR
jgi:nitrite reductase (NADH) small subunit